MEFDGVYVRRSRTHKSCSRWRFIQMEYLQRVNQAVTVLVYTTHNDFKKTLCWSTELELKAQ